MSRSIRVPAPRPPESAPIFSDALREEQVQLLAQLDCLLLVQPEHLRQLSELSVLRTFLPGGLVIDERTPSHYLYILLRGTVCLRLHDRSGREVLIGFLDRGDCFGEGQLFGDQFRNASARAETLCYALQIPLRELRVLLEVSQELATTLQRIYRDRLVASTLGRIPLFGQLSPLARAGIAEKLLQHHYQRDVPIIEQGQPGEALYLIESGQVVVEADHQAIAHLEEGDFFGEMSLLTSEPHNADVRTLTPTDLLVLPANAFARVLELQPALAEQMRLIVIQRRAAKAAIQTDMSHAQQLGSAIQRGILRGRHVLVRDPERCPEGCKICVDACSIRHGAPRLRATGVLINQVEVVDTCRQCRVGAECVEACPVDAIRWQSNGALKVIDTCNGCGDCVEACPYDAIQIVTPRPSISPMQRVRQRVQHFFQPTIPLQQAEPQPRAIKCDLCAGYNDLACVSACPTGALRLMPVEEVWPS